MPNMSYCRFENTLSDLLECEEHFSDDDLSKDESKARAELLEICQRIVDEFGEEDEDN